MTKNRNRTYDKETDTLQHLKSENKHLKREVVRLRKELDRIYNRYDNLDDLVQQHYKEESPKEDLKKKWACNECKEGYLKLIIINRRDGSFYFRKCSMCDHRTRLKKYTENVAEGPK